MINTEKNNIWKFRLFLDISYFFFMKVAPKDSVCLFLKTVAHLRAFLRLLGLYSQFCIYFHMMCKQAMLQCDVCPKITQQGSAPVSG